MNPAFSILSGLALNVAAVDAVQAQAAPNPAEIFRDVCLHGSASFAEGSLMPVEAGDLPWSLRSGFGHFDHRVPRAQRFGAPASGTRFFRLAASDAYLMTAEGSSGPCAVFWDGGHWDEVRSALDGWIAVPAAPFLRTRGGDVWMETDLDGHALAVANYQGWIMMRAELLGRLKPEENAN